MTQEFQTILGIKFFVGDFEGLLDLCSQGHFIVVPSAPSLSDLEEDAASRESVEKSDFAVPDSGLMVLLWKVFTGQRLPRISGLRLLRGLLDTPELKRSGASFWIMPSVAEKQINLSWLQRQGFSVREEDCFVAPMYPKGPITAPDLVTRIEARKPRYVFINLGGGVQERLGFHLKTHLSYRPTLLCVGAAIAFITGIQANIPPWADRWFLGWFFRCLTNPRKFIPRYWKALRFIGILFRYRDRSISPIQPRP